MKRDFIQKTNRLRRWQSSVPKNHLPRVRIQASFILKAEGMWLIVAILAFVLGTIPIGLVTMFL